MLQDSLGTGIRSCAPPSVGPDPKQFGLKKMEAARFQAAFEDGAHLPSLGGIDDEGAADRIDGRAVADRQIAAPANPTKKTSP